MTLRSGIKIAVAILAVGLLGGLAALAWILLAPRHVPPGQPPFATLDSGSLGEFREVFNAHGDEVRLLVMLSPT